MTYEDNVRVFVDTLNRSYTKFRKQTLEAIKATEFKPDVTKIFVNKVDAKDNIRFERGGSASVAYACACANPNSRVAVLNFADAVSPGGFVFDGPFTQEENLCRCSNLFPVLYNNKDYYVQNRNASDDYYGVYTNGALYSKNVVFFKDDTNYRILKPMCIDVITCPAPSVRSAEANLIIFKRVEGIIKLAASMCVDIIVLGAWGCGAFGQSPVTVARAFKSALMKYNHFERVIFAVRPTVKGSVDLFNIMKKVVEEN